MIFTNFAIFDFGSESRDTERSQNLVNNNSCNNNRLNPLSTSKNCEICEIHDTCALSDVTSEMFHFQFMIEKCDPTS